MDKSVARELALRKHGNQVYRGFGVVPDEPYINHLDRVAAHFPFVHQLQQIAYVHDILEDTDCTVRDLWDVGFAGSETEAIVLMTKDKSTDLNRYYAAIKENKLARSVKLADLNDNLSQSVKKGLGNKAMEYATWVEYLTSETK